MHTDQTKTRVLSNRDVQQIVQDLGLHVIMDAMIERLEEAMKTFDPTRTEIPVRAGFDYQKPHTGLIEWMPLHQVGQQVMVKIVGYHPSNPETYQIPTIVSTISTYDTSSGHLIGIMDGVVPTALRTGAGSAIASKYMAKVDSRTLGLIGCGAQSVTQLHALSRVFDLERVLIYDSNAATERSFAARCAVLDVDAPISPASISDIVEQSDILCTATSVAVGKGPLFALTDTKAHLHVNAVGSDFPGKVELPLDLLQKSFVCPDFREQAVLEGECQQLKASEIGPDIVQLIQGASQYDHIRDQYSVYDSTGWALQDQVAMELFLEYAEAMKLGQEIEIENMLLDSKNPYDFLGALPLQMPLKKVVYRSSF